jgi:hypothetical protein
MCNFHLGAQNFFEWAINTSLTSYNSALLSGSFKNNDSFYTALSTYYHTKLSTLYPNQIANVTFMSSNTTATGRCGLTFRSYFINTISDSTLRTNIVSNIQMAYYGILTQYFTTATKSMKIPTSCQINVPTAISKVTTNTIFTISSSSIQSLLSGQK